MNSNRTWPLALRLVWLSGGLVAVNEPAEVDVHLRANVIGRTFYTFQIQSYPSLFVALKALGLSIIGTTFVTDERQLEGLRAPEFRAASPVQGWPVWRAWQSWRHIMFAAGKRDEVRLIGVAARIASGLKYSEMRLGDLAGSYSMQLHSHLSKEEPKFYQAFIDTNSAAVYKDIHALFWEMAFLRDALAEFFASFCLGRAQVRRFSSLVRSLKGMPLNDPLALEILRISDPKNRDGWLSQFGNYRDCFTHSAPLELARGFATAVQDLISLRNGIAVPQVYYALPADPAQLISDRSKGILFSTPEDMARNGIQKRDRVTEPDALAYLHRTLIQIPDLSSRLAARSPIAPEPLVIGKDDLIGGIKISRA